MMTTKQRYGKFGGNVAYHGYQSFKTDEVTPDEAHQIGIEAAKRMWKEYEVVVTTHLNTDNIHNHIVVNSVSFKTGRKFENHVSDHYRLREISDLICEERGKSVLPPSKFKGSSKKEYWVKKNGGMTHRDMLRKDVDEALSQSCSFREIEYYLKTLGYKFERDFYYDHPSVYADGWKRAVRISSLGEQYSKENIHKQCIENQRKPELYTFVTPAWKRRPLLVLERDKYISGWDDTIIVLFELFIEILKICIVGNTQEYDNRPVSPMMRAEMRKLDRYIEEYNLLCDNNLDSPKKLLDFQENLSSRILDLEQERYALRLKLRRVKTPEEDAALKEQCKEITKKITPLRKEYKIAMRIEEHIPKIKALLDAERNIEMKRNNLNKNKERGKER